MKRNKTSHLGLLLGPEDGRHDFRPHEESRYTESMPKFLVVLVVLHSAAAWSGGNIRQICQDANTAPLRKSETLQEAGQAVCRLGSHHSSDQEVMKLVGHVQGMIQKLQADKKAAKNWKENSDLQQAYAGLVERINAKIEPEKTDTKSPVRDAMLALTAKFSTREERDANPGEYIRQVEDVIRLTAKGPALLACFHQHLPTIGPGRFQLAPADDKDLMGFNIKSKVDPDYSFNRVITFNNEFPPLQAVVLLAHEFQHSCNSENAQKCLNANPAGQVSNDCRQSFAVDELKAYRLESEFFADIAKEVPNMACGFSYVSPAFGNVPVRAADAEASNQETIESGDFLHRLISNYVQIGTYKSADIFYENSKPGQPPQLRQDFREKIEAAGFHTK